MRKRWKRGETEKKIKYEEVKDKVQKETCEENVNNIVETEVMVIINAQEEHIDKIK